ncbi:MAG: hypothetical protein LUC22_02135 [Prevotella sp.]|nr:hypothetical protein [Prevotella sp.]
MIYKIGNRYFNCKAKVMQGTETNKQNPVFHTRPGAGHTPPKQISGLFRPGVKAALSASPAPHDAGPNARTTGRQQGLSLVRAPK